MKKYSRAECYEMLMDFTRVLEEYGWPSQEAGFARLGFWQSVIGMSGVRKPEKKLLPAIYVQGSLFNIGAS